MQFQKKCSERYVENSLRVYRAKHGSSAARRLVQSLNNEFVDKPIPPNPTEGTIVDESEVSEKTAGDAINLHQLKNILAENDLYNQSHDKKDLSGGTVVVMR